MDGAGAGAGAGSDEELLEGFGGGGGLAVVFCRGDCEVGGSIGTVCGPKSRMVGFQYLSDDSSEGLAMLLNRPNTSKFNST